MPIYDYRCKGCHHETELLIKASEEAPLRCPKCEQMTMARCVSAPRFRLGGTGWYETDEKPKDKQRNVLQKEDTSAPASPSSETSQ